MSGSELEGAGKEGEAEELKGSCISVCVSQTEHERMGGLLAGQQVLFGTYSVKRRLFSFAVGLF